MITYEFFIDKTVYNNLWYTYFKADAKDELFFQRMIVKL